MNEPTTGSHEEGVCSSDLKIVHHSRVLDSIHILNHAKCAVLLSNPITQLELPRPDPGARGVEGVLGGGGQRFERAIALEGKAGDARVVVDEDMCDWIEFVLSGGFIVAQDLGNLTRSSVAGAVLGVQNRDGLQAARGPHQGVG